MSEKKRTIADLVQQLLTENPEDEVEYIIIKKSGEVVCMDARSHTKSMIKVLKMCGWW